MLRLTVLSSAIVLALAGTALAQTAPNAARGATFALRGASFALRGAYHAIGDAEARGASPYLDAAKNHYRGALARLQRNDPGAASEAMAAAALARAALAEHPVPAPRDIPAPPAVADDGHAMMPPRIERPPLMLHGPGASPQQPMPGMAHMRAHHGHGYGRDGGFDATRLAADVKLADSAETRDLAQKAVDADIARTRAAFSGNADEAMRQGRLASSLAMAVRSLAQADHPRTFPRGPMAPGAARSASLAPEAPVVDRPETDPN